jgi:Tol biopolymer transport system component
MTENGLIVQYFQRARFEWHGEHPAAYRVQLGLLGDEAIGLGKAVIPDAAAPKAAVLAPPPIPASLAGPGKLLVSTGAGGEFFLMDPNGSNSVRLGRGVDPSIAPDASRVVYAKWEDPNPGLYVIDVAGGKPRLIFEGRELRGPVYSPNMQEIAFWDKYICERVVRGRPNTQEDCFRVKVIPAEGGADWLIPGQSQWARSPTWAPDGQRIGFKDEKGVFVASRKDDARPLSKFEPRYSMPAWSPKGSLIAVAFASTRDHSEIGVLPDDGSVAFTPLTESPPFQSPAVTSLSPAWSPDGSRVAFASDRDGQMAIWTMAADGSNAVKVSDLPLVNNNVDERFVSWGGR